MKRLLSLLILPVLAMLFWGPQLCFHATASEETGIGGSLADFERATAELSKARQADGQVNVECLRRAEKDYLSCLARQEKTAGKSLLFENARYNLEITRLLLAQAGQANQGPNERSPSKPDAGAGKASPEQLSWNRPPEPQPDCCPT
jgi:hypothetical protein